MFTHQQTLDAINAALRVLDRPELPGIPVAAPGHAQKCVLGCSLGADLVDMSRSTNIQILDATNEEVELVAQAWREHGVLCERYQGAIQFRGGLHEWMQAFDGGKWEVLIVDGYDADDHTWDGGDNPGARTVRPDQIVYAEGE